MNLYILGGRQRKRLLWPVVAEHRFEAARIIRLDTDAHTSNTIVEYETLPEARAHRKSSNLFTSGTVCANKLYTCTYTEILVFELPTFRRLAYLSLPRFNALHHVCPTRRGTLLVANTGLDMVMEIAGDGRVLREWNVLGDHAWGRSSQDIDYRKVPSTKPHRSHPNFVFEIGDDVWVTRFHQRDAICLTNPAKRIDISIERPHDGLLHDGLLYFTTVDGHLVIVDAKSLEMVSTFDLRQFRGREFSGPGWCRGLLVVNKDLVWVGFTRIRKTLLMQSLNWIKHGFRGLEAPTHVALFDLVNKCCLKAINLEPHRLNILFSIFNADAQNVWNDTKREQ
jgi:hypothetical protein